jgi:hypothetical protein
MATAGQIFVVSLAGIVVGSIGYQGEMLLRSYYRWGEPFPVEPRGCGLVPAALTGLRFLSYIVSSTQRTI